MTASRPTRETLRASPGFVAGLIRAAPGQGPAIAAELGAEAEITTPTLPAEVRNLERWAAFHEAVERLGDEDRGLIELGFYEGLAKDEMARLLGVDERTVRRWWNRATRRLADTLGDDIPS